MVVGGRNSNNTRQLAQKAVSRGLPTLQVERPEELEPEWFVNARDVGVTAGTSTLDETVQAVVERIRWIGTTSMD